MSSHRVTVCRRDELTPGGAGRFDVEGLAVAVVRIVDEVHVIGDRSTHEGVSLSEGQVDEDERLVECWNRCRSQVPQTFARKGTHRIEHADQ